MLINEKHIPTQLKSLKEEPDDKIPFVNVSLVLAIHSKFGKVVLLSDSQAAIQAIGSQGDALSDEVLQCRRLIKLLALINKRVVIQWIPSHCNIYGNEQADFPARKGTQILQPSFSGLSYHSMKLHIKNIMKMNALADLRESIRNKNWRETDIKAVPGKPRRDAVATFRLLTGHDCLGKHLYRIGIYDHPQCQLCGSGAPMNREHLHCCKRLHGLDSETARYWRGRELSGR
ncbi:uncharacterized protein [Parasteatoda tepidariorum]|uniref:uncharacterized protein n=1 Tax=Parasteatoda tepidariorum TaxID=114398 RepID=UPI00077FAFE5|nr:uncharacterized protein LOC122270002 [Parasteatoda tepidariorum]